jgi:hypothetical protein
MELFQQKRKAESGNQIFNHQDTKGAKRNETFGGTPNAAAETTALPNADDLKSVMEGL